MAVFTVRGKKDGRQSGLFFKRALLGVILIALVMLPRLLNLDIFIGPDEMAELGRDNNFALALARGDLAGTLVGDGKPSVTLMWINTVGVTGKWLWLRLSGDPRPFEQVVAPERPFSVWPERRMFLALVSGLQILAAWLLLRRIWNEQIATLAVGLMALEPFLLAFTRIIRGDALLAGFMILSLLGALAFLKTGQRGYNFFSGAMAGLALLTKLSGGAMVITIALLYGIALLNQQKVCGPTSSPEQIRKEDGLNSSFRPHPSAFFIWAFAAAVIFFGLWPAWWFRPVETFDLLWNKGLFHAVEAGQGGAELYFWGAVHPSGPGLWFYPVLAGLRLTPWLLLGSFIAVGRWLWSNLRRRAGPELTLLGVLIYIGVYWLVITLPDQKLDRFFTPIVPALAILTAVEVANLVQWLSERANHRLKQVPIMFHVSRLTYPAILLIGLALTWHVSRYHPLYSTYFNPLSGPPEFWAWALPIGHGEGVNTALSYLSNQDDMAAKTLVCGTNLPRCEPFFGGKLLPQEDLRSGAWFKADYVLWHVDEEQMDVFPAEVLAYLRRQPPVFVARYDGLDYTWLYPVPRPAFLASEARLEGVARLYGYDAGQDFAGLKPGDRINLRIYWQNEGQAQQQQFWWRVVDGSGYVWSEAAARPLPEFEAAASQKGAVVEGAVSLTLPADMPPGPYVLKAGFAKAQEEVGQFPLPADGSRLVVSGVPVGPSQPIHVLDHLLAPGLRLRGYDLSSDKAVPGETIWLVLFWQAVSSIQRDYALTLRLVDPTGQPVQEWPKLQPVSNTYPTSAWPANSSVRGPQPVSLAEELAPGQYRFELGLVDGTAPSSAADKVGVGVINVVSRKTVFDAPPMQFPAKAVFGDIATLLGYDLAGDLSPDGVRVTVTLYWQAQRSTTQPYQVSLRLVDSSSNTTLAEQTAEPVQGSAPTTGWQAGEIITDRHELVTASSQPASVNLEIRFLADTHQPAPLADGQPFFVVPEVQQKVSWRTP
ncbi:MAG: glycosyltransferase family 39 protein [Anaerolineae bacterium]|nr:glycosyltransferase family 39 protein [Anaerolineae bacterium]